MTPPVPADLLLKSGPYTLWVMPSVHYVQVVDTVGSIIENRTDIGRRSSVFIRSAAPTYGRYLTVAYAGAEPSPPTLRELGGDRRDRRARCSPNEPTWRRGPLPRRSCSSNSGGLVERLVRPGLEGDRRWSAGDDGDHRAGDARRAGNGWSSCHPFHLRRVSALLGGLLVVRRVHSRRRRRELPMEAQSEIRARRNGP